MASVEPVLVPSLHPGDGVVMDNLACYKGGDRCRVIEAGGAPLLYLPPSSPDFNPLAPGFATLEARLRAGAARPVARLWAGRHVV